MLQLGMSCCTRWDGSRTHPDTCAFSGGSISPPRLTCSSETAHVPRRLLRLSKTYGVHFFVWLLYEAAEGRNGEGAHPDRRSISEQNMILVLESVTAWVAENPRGLSTGCGSGLRDSVPTGLWRQVVADSSGACRQISTTSQLPPLHRRKCKNHCDCARFEGA